MAKKKSKDTPLQGKVSMSEDAPLIGQKVYYIDHREGHGVFPAIVTDVSDDGSFDLNVFDINAAVGYFTIKTSAHDEGISPGMWHYPK